MKLEFKKRYILISFSVLSLVIFFFYSINRHTRYYSYSPKIDYDYTSSKFVYVKLINSNFSVPRIIDSTYSVFAKINIESTLLGSFRSPHIKLFSEQLELRQDLEYATEGFRYINISNFLKKNENSIHLDAVNCRINSDSIQLIYFKNIELENSRIMLISPHPDDAEIAAFGLYNSYPDSTYIITITAGDLGEFEYADNSNIAINKSFIKGKIRTWNSLTVPLLADVPQDNILNLGYFDGTLKKMYDTKEEFYTSITDRKIGPESFWNYNLSILKDSLYKDNNWESLNSNLKMLLKTIRPNIIITPYPYLDSHTDHKYSTIALIQAIRDLKMYEGNLFLYTNHLPKSEYYPFGTKGGIVSLPPNFSNDIFYRSIQSFALNDEDQFDKFLALDAMIDIRPKTTFDYFKRSVFEFIKAYYPVESSHYFNRSLRSNELFFVIPISDVKSNIKLEKLIVGNSKY